MYRLKNDRFEYKAGTVVFDFRGPDYGCSSTDSYITQIPHITVTEHANGDGPFFTVPVPELENL